MQRKSLGKQIWEVFSPILVYLGITVLVETVIIVIYYMRSLPELIAAMETEEALMEYILNLSTKVLSYVVEITAIAAVITLPILLLMKKKDRQKDEAAGILQGKKAPLAKYIYIVGLSISFAVGINNILTLSNLAEYSVAYQEVADALYTPNLWVQILCLGIMIPITEEYIFRGLIYRRMRQNLSVIRAILLSALVFGIYHGNSVQMIYGGLCGILLAYVYEKYGSMKAPILAHMLMNTVACVLTGVEGFEWMFTQPMRMAVITIACAAIGSTMFLFIRDIEQVQETETQETEMLQ